MGCVFLIERSQNKNELLLFQSRTQGTPQQHPSVPYTDTSNWFCLVPTLPWPKIWSHASTQSPQAPSLLCKHNKIHTRNPNVFSQRLHIPRHVDNIFGHKSSQKHKPLKNTHIHLLCTPCAHCAWLWKTLWAHCGFLLWKTHPHSSRWITTQFYTLSPQVIHNANLAVPYLTHWSWINLPLTATLIHRLHTVIIIIMNMY